jgi:hypothetical protein
MLLFECLLTLDGSETRLPGIDRLEGIHPGDPVSTVISWSLSEQTRSIYRLGCM